MCIPNIPIRKHIFLKNISGNFCKVFKYPYTHLLSGYPEIFTFAYLKWLIFCFNEWIKMQVLYPCHFYLNKPYSVEHKTFLFLLIILVNQAEYWNCFIPRDLELTEVESLVLAVWYFVEAAMEENKKQDLQIHLVKKKWGGGCETLYSLLNKKKPVLQFGDPN